MHELTFDEVDVVSGGIVPVVIGIVAVGVVAAVAIGVGVYNGYQDEKLKAKVSASAR
jgi:lactobin A/cerein 7B family class IIb bacteriocin